MATSIDADMYEESQPNIYHELTLMRKKNLFEKIWWREQKIKGYVDPMKRQWMSNFQKGQECQGNLQDITVILKKGGT